MLKINNLSQSFTVDNEELTAFKNLRLEIKTGEFFTIVGPSGCGKSTLLRVISGLLTPTGGHLVWEKPVKTSFVFQNYALFPYLTVFENIEFGLLMQDVAPDKRKLLVDELINEVGLNGFAGKHPKELSGGMKQRVGIARALAVSPNLLLLDEPFSSLDEFTAETLRQLLLNLWQKHGLTVIMVTHLVSEAVQLADRVAVMSSSPGRLLAVIDNPLPRPRNTRSKESFSLEDKILALINNNP